MNRRDNDPIGALLKHSMTSSRIEADADCPDADLLAAFADGGLAATERTAVERHAASCARCARVLAFAVEDHPATTSPRSALHWPLTWRWLLPAATAATVAAIWFATQPFDRTPATSTAPASQMAREVSPRADERGGRDSLDESTSPAPPSPGLPPAAPQANTQKETANPDRFERRQQAPAALSELDKRLEPAAEVPPADFAAAGRAAPDSQAEAITVERERTADSAATDVSAQPPAAPPPAAAPAPPAAAAPAPPPPNATRAPLQPRTESGVGQGRSGVDGGRAGAALRDTNTPLRIASPNRTIAWRVRDRVVERSGDGGATWAQELVAPRPIFAGVAPSADVVWLTGANGLVLRRTRDGWTTANAPAPANLTTIASVADNEATVGTADGRSFRTVDGGQSWMPQ